MSAKTFFLSIIGLLLTPGLLQASAIKQMYEVSLAVPSQQKNIRGAAYEKGLIEVSMRISGNSAVPVQLDLKQATRMISQYRYYSMSSREISAYMKQNASAVRPRYRLWMKFDEAKVKQQLRERGLPIWGYQRPNVLVWLAVKDGRNRYLLKKSDSSQIKDALEKEARKRGLPVIWPAYDAEDKKQLSFIDVWGTFWGPIKQVSQRYSPDAILLGKMSWMKGNWQVNWSLQLEDRNENWQLSALEMSAITRSGIGVATDYISSRFAVFENGTNGGELVLRISDLSGVKEYAAASHYLASLAPVKSVYAKEIKPSKVDFLLELNGDENDLKRVIALGRVLMPDNRPEDVERIETPLKMPVNSFTGSADVINTVGEGAQNTGSVNTGPIPIPEVEVQQKPQAHVLRYRISS